MRTLSLTTLAGTLLLLTGLTFAQSAGTSCAAPDWSNVTESATVWNPCAADKCDEYVGQVKGKVHDMWLANPITAKAKSREVVQLRVKFRRDGSVETETVVKSKNVKLNKAAEDAVLFAGPYPEFPATWTQQEVVTCANFYYAPPGKK